MMIYLCNSGLPKAHILSKNKFNFLKIYYIRIETFNRVFHKLFEDKYSGFRILQIELKYSLIYLYRLIDDRQSVLYIVRSEYMHWNRNT